MKRRDFISMLPAAIGLGMYSCRRPLQKIAPAVYPTEYIKPGIAAWYSTAYREKNVCYGAMVKCFEDKPVKIEGNPGFPANNGSSSARMQTALFSLYDPDRFRQPRVDNIATDISEALQATSARLAEVHKQGKKTYIVMEEHCSPSFKALTQEITETFDWIHFVTLPTIYSSQPKINKSIFGVDAEIVPNLQQAKFIVSIECDFLGTEKYALYHTGNYSKFKTSLTGKPGKAGHIAIESAHTLTGANADRRIAINPKEIEPFLASLLQALIRQSGDRLNLSEILSWYTDDFRNIAKPLAALLLQHLSEGVVLCGSLLPVRAHALVLAINCMLSSVGNSKAIYLGLTIPNSEDKSENIEQFIHSIDSGETGAIVFTSVNPMYSAGSRLIAALDKIPTGNKISLSLYDDETAEACSVCIPAAHWLECWSDAQSFDGTGAVCQPVIAPLNTDSISTEDFLFGIAKLLDGDAFKDFGSYYDFLKARWLSLLGGEEEWEEVLRNGYHKDDKPIKKGFDLNIENLKHLIKPEIGVDSSKGVRCSFLPSLYLDDGGDANNPWLQELPDPVTKLCWGNAAIIGLSLAGRLMLESGDVVSIDNGNTSVEAPVLVSGGVADDTIVLTLGYGRSRGGRFLNGCGANFFHLYDHGNNNKIVQIKKLNRRLELSLSQRQIPNVDSVMVRETTYHNAADQPVEQTGNNISAFEPYQYKGSRWAMAIDLNLCTGCGACIAACQAENNIPAVGADEARRGRNMHWIRIDSYKSSSDSRGGLFLFQPMLCQHCELAPCESVCPVLASTHSPEGLSEVTYNRCIGSRHCIANCPYKVRRFNFYDYTLDRGKPLNLRYNPNVTLRSRGVVEKCSFCIQRIVEAKFKAADEGRTRLTDLEFKTACQQACPAGAITAGNLNDPQSNVSKLWKSPRAFWALSSVNTKPSVAYLEKVRRNLDLTIKI